jgi:glutamate-1-semialdehyde 2,1-aminomutase
MDLFGDGAVNHSGTFNASVMAMAAVIATMRQLQEERPHEKLARVGTALMEGLKTLAEERDVPLRVQGVPAAFWCSFGPQAEARTFSDLRHDDANRYREFAAQLADAGVWVTTRGIWYLSTAHDDSDVEQTLARVAKILRAPEYAGAAVR